MMKYIILTALAVLLMFNWLPIAADEAVVGVNELAYGAVEDVEVDPQRLSIAVSLIESAMTDNQIPGAVILVARRGKIILHEAFGWRNVDRTIPMKRDSLFRMASNSKAVTAVAIMLLVNDGKVELDESPGKYLPAFRNNSWDKITIRQLLTHTSGLRIKPIFLNPLMEKSDEHPGAPDLRLEVDRFAEIPPEVEPGTSYAYCNAGYNTLAAVIEQVAGSYIEYLRMRIYEPLGMADSCNHESDADNSRMSTVMQRTNKGHWTASWTPGDAPDYPFPRGSGGMVSTALDFARFCQMMLNGGTLNHHRVLDESSVRLATNPHSEFIPAAKTYSLGWSVKEPGGTFSHSGSDGTYAWVDPKLQIVGLILTQCKGGKIPRSRFQELICQACVKGELGSTSIIEADAVKVD